LIINQRIDQIILIEDEAEATALMSIERLANVKACYTMDRNTAGLGHQITWGSMGGLSSTYLDVYKGLPRMKGNVDDQIKFVQLRNLVSKIS